MSSDSTASDISDEAATRKATSVVSPQSEIALRLQQEMNKKNLDQLLFKQQASHSFNAYNNSAALTAFELMQHQNMLYGQQYQQQAFAASQVNGATAGLFGLSPLQQQQLVGTAGTAAAYQNKMNSYQSDKRSSIHYKPY